MRILHESFERMIAKSTISGQIAFAETDSAKAIGGSIELAVEVLAAMRQDEDSKWSLQLLMIPTDAHGPFWVDAEVHWGHSSPLVIIENQEVPTIGTISARLVVYNLTVAGGWRSGGKQGTFHGTFQLGLKSAEHGTYVIERTSEMNRDWWTGSRWSDNPREAKWFDYEPHAPSEAGEEGGYTVYYPAGKIDH